MKLETSVIDHVLRAMSGKLLDSAALHELTRRLDSQEEFLAWLLITEDAFQGAPELRTQLRTLAMSQHSSPATRRQASDYPLALETGRQRLASDITALLDAHGGASTTEDQLHADRIRYAQACAIGEAPIRDLLAIRKPTPSR